MQALYETVKGIIDSGRIGVPVFARLLVNVPPGVDKAEEILARIINMERLWLGAIPNSIYTQCDSDSGHINATIQYKDGKTAIGGISIVPGTDVAFDLMLLGNKGGIYHDSHILSIIADVEAEPLPEALKMAVAASIKTGKPVTVKEVAGSE